MRLAEWAAVVSAVVAVISMFGSGIGWWRSRKAARTSAHYAQRSVDASEKSAQAQETQARLATEQVAEAESKPWKVEPIPGSDNCRLINTTAKPKYGVRVEGPAVRRPTVGIVDGNSFAELDTMLSFGGTSKSVTITWHLAQDLTDNQGVQHTHLPIG
jgi:hypothetical protein